MDGLEIADPKPFHPMASEAFVKRPRICGIQGVGTFATQNSARFARIAVAMNVTSHMNHVLAFDNSADSIYKAILQLSHLKPKRRLPFRRRKDSFRAFVSHLPGIRTNAGFNRDLTLSLESVPRMHSVIKRQVAAVREHAIKCGTKVTFNIRPTSLSGGHAGPAQWLLNHELRAQGLNGFEIGLAAMPGDPLSLNIFKQIFPLMVGSKRYGFKAWVIWDNNLASGMRTEQQQDQMVLQGIMGTFSAYLHDTSAPGPGDVWNALANAGCGFIGVSAVKEDISVRRKLTLKPKFRKNVSDKETIIEGVRSGISRVLDDRSSRLIDTDVGKGVPQFIIVTGNIHREDYDEGLEQTLVPKNVITLLAPSWEHSITVIRFFPVKSRIMSVNRVLGLPVRRKLSNGELLPDEAIERSIESLWDVVEKTADFVGAKPEELLEGK